MEQLCIELVSTVLEKNVFPLLLSPDWPVGGVTQVEETICYLIVPDAMLEASADMARRNRRQTRKQTQTQDQNTSAHKHKKNAKEKHNKKGILERMGTPSGGPGQTWERGPD